MQGLLDTLGAISFSTVNGIPMGMLVQYGFSNKIHGDGTTMRSYWMGATVGFFVTMLFYPSSTFFTMAPPSLLNGMLLGFMLTWPPKDYVASYRKFSHCLAEMVLDASFHVGAPGLFLLFWFLPKAGSFLSTMLF